MDSVDRMCRECGLIKSTTQRRNCPSCGSVLECEACWSNHRLQIEADMKVEPDKDGK